MAVSNLRNLLAGIAFVLMGGAAAAQDGNVTIYSSNPEQALETVTSVAATEMKGVKVNMVTGGSGAMLRRIEAEKAKPQADVFWTSSANTLGAFSSLFEPYKSKNIDAIPAELHYPGDLFTATIIHVVVFMVNKDQLGDLPEPKTWEDLLNPAYKGKIIIADPGNSSTGYTVLWGVSKLLGPDKYKQLAQNMVVTGTSQAVPLGVSQGEYAVGLTFESSAYPYVAGGQEEVELVYPNDGTFVSPEYLGLVKDAPDGALARQAVDFLTSKEVEEKLFKTTFRRPARSDIAVSKIIKMPELSDIKVFKVDENEAAKERETFLDQWKKIGAQSAD